MAETVETGRRQTILTTSGPTTRLVTTRAGESDADACRRLGWAIGTRLVGDEGRGPTVIRLTAIGERSILAVCETGGGRYESMWTLSCRDWQPVSDDASVQAS